MKFRIIVASLHQQECTQHQREDMLRQALAELLASNRLSVWKLPGICPDCVVSTSGVIRNQSFSFYAGVLCRVVLLPRLRTCFPFSSNLLDLLLT